MRVFRSLKAFKSEKPVVLTQGTFDGVHLGHQKILDQVISEAKAIEGESVMLTFFPHPRMVLNASNQDLKLITSLDEKIEILGKQGLDKLLILPFTASLSQLEPYQFIEQILHIGMKTRRIVIGYDHKFGRDRKGNIEEIKKYASEFQYKVTEIPQQDIDNSVVSSTQVRKCILNGDITCANKLLGRHFSFQGTVIEGNKIGRKHGFPTANIQISESYKIIPKVGVYAVTCIVNGMKVDGMLNIGARPTFNDNKNYLEVHLFDFDNDIYGKVVKVNCVSKMRDGMKFENPNKLIDQLKQDKKTARSILK